MYSSIFPVSNYIIIIIRITLIQGVSKHILFNKMNIRDMKVAMLPKHFRDNLQNKSY